jgi:hypothetical protein
MAPLKALTVAVTALHRVATVSPPVPVAIAPTLVPSSRVAQPAVLKAAPSAASNPVASVLPLGVVTVPPTAVSSSPAALPVPVVKAAHLTPAVAATQRADGMTGA